MNKCYGYVCNTYGEKLSIDEQACEIDKYANIIGLTLTGIIQDKYSKNVESRMRVVLTTLKNNDTLIIYSVTALTGNKRHARNILAISNELAKQNSVLKVVKNNSTSDTIHGRYRLTIQASFEQLEYEKLAEMQETEIKSGGAGSNENETEVEVVTI